MSLVETLQALARQPVDPAILKARHGEREAAREAALGRHGGEASLMSPGPEETALVEVCRPHVEAGRLDALSAPEVADMDPELVRVVREAVPFPVTVAGLLAEHRHWSALMADRFVVDGDRPQPVAVYCRRNLLEAALDEVPATEFADIEARLAWMGDVLDLDFARDVRLDARCLATLKGDIVRLAAREIALP